MEIITALAGFCLGFVVCLAWVIYTKNDLALFDDKSLMYPIDKPSPNRIFIERHIYPYGDRRILNQSWPEQVSRASGAAPVDERVLIPWRTSHYPPLDKDRT